MRRHDRRHRYLAVWAALGVLTALNLRAEPQTVSARVDVSGLQEEIRIFVVRQPAGGTGRPAHWHQSAEKNKMYAVFEMPAHRTEWRPMTFAFMPTKSGKVQLQLRGMCHRLDGVTQRLWVVFDSITVEGAEIRNPGFEEAANSQDAAKHWQQHRSEGFRAVRVAGEGQAHSGAAAMEVTHDQFASQALRVEADRIVTVTVWQRRSPNQ